MHRLPWTDSEIATQKRLTEAGASLSDISEYFGGRRSADAIRNFRSRQSAGPKKQSPWTEENLQKLKELASDNSASEIGRLLGFSRNAIIGKVHRLGIRLNIKYNQGDANRARSNLPKTYKPRKERRVTAHNGVHGSRLFEFVDVSTDLPASHADKPSNIIDLPKNGCRWPCEGEGFNAVFCGGDKCGDLPYCPRHCRMAYRP